MNATQLSPAQLAWVNKTFAWQIRPVVRAKRTAESVVELKTEGGTGAVATCSVTRGKITVVFPSECGMWWVNGNLVPYHPDDKITIVEEGNTL